MDALERLENLLEQDGTGFADTFRLTRTAAFRFGLEVRRDPDTGANSATSDLPELEATPGLKGVLFRKAAALDNLIRNRRQFEPYRNTNATKIVAQGDSWFAFPFVEPRDVSENLADLLPVYSLGCPGDDVSDMSSGRKLGDLIAALKDTDADIVALSGGGNELIGDDFPTVLNTTGTPRSATDFIEPARLRAKIASVVNGFEVILGELVATKPDVQICAHGYDYPFPRRDEGTFLGPVLDDLNIPERYWHGICAHIIDQFDEALTALSRRHPQNFFRVDLRGVAGNDVANWADEIHLNSETAKLAAGKFLVQFENRLGSAFRMRSD